MAGPEFPSCQPLPQLLTGGYDDDYFVDPAPESLHCPVCLLVLREPHLISCCGTHICQVCIERIQANEQSCPCCRSENYINVLNKEKRGKVLELKVCCVNSAKGCEWVGELGDQDRHCTSRCHYVEAVCQYGCGESYPRFMLGKHEQDECPERPIDMKIATFTKQMMEKVSTLETKYEGEITALKQKLEDQEERHIMEKKELQRNYEEGKKEMQHEFEVQTEEMKEKAEEYKEQMLQIIKKEQEKCEAKRKELANKLEKQREEYELEKREMKKMKKEDKEDLQHQFEALQKITEKDKKEVLLQLAVHNNCDKDMREKLIALQRSAETLKIEVEQYENKRKALEEKLESAKQQMQEKQMKDQYKAEIVAFKKQQAEEISQLKKDISHLKGIPDITLLSSTGSTFFKPPIFPKTTIMTPDMTVNSSSDAVTKTAILTTTTPTPTQNPGCPICLNEVLTDPVITNCCKNQFCRVCIDQAMLHSPYCPICKTPLRKVEGNQPLGGTMNHHVYGNPLPGYPKCGTITITYYIPSGTQGPEHPNPGRHYHGTSRTAYLPDNPEGREVLKLLQKAFEARLIFTVGTSPTSGRSNTVVWNDIHHKTSTHGGSSGCGYPDPTYLQRVKEELNAKGIH